jgi:hypothetical protein
VESVADLPPPDIPLLELPPPDIPSVDLPLPDIPSVVTIGVGLVAEPVPMSFLQPAAMMLAIKAITTKWIRFEIFMSVDFVVLNGFKNKVLPRESYYLWKERP